MALSLKKLELKLIVNPADGSVVRVESNTDLGSSDSATMTDPKGVHSYIPEAGDQTNLDVFALKVLNARKTQFGV